MNASKAASAGPFTPADSPKSSRSLEAASGEAPESGCEDSLQDPTFFARNSSALVGVFLVPINILLVFAPIGIISTYLECSSLVLFFANFIAIIPLAQVLGDATEALAAHTGQIIGGLLNATFGNAVEMIMCIQAIKRGLIQVVQGNLMGSILSNLLLVLGMALWAAGINNKEAKFNSAGAQANMSCQILASISIALPTMYSTVEGAKDILTISRICAFNLVLVYGLFLFFQLKTHSHLFQDEGDGAEEEEEEQSQMSASVACALLACTTLVISACSEGLVDSIEDVSVEYGLPKAFIGLILLPIIGNACEHSTAVTCAYKGMMDLALGVAVGSSTQIALFVVPVAVLFGWAYDQPMDLNFRGFDSIAMMLSVFLCSQVLQHGHANWLHGAMLMATYVLIAIVAWFIPED